MVQNEFIKRVAIIGGVRTPFCRSNTAYRELSNLDMMGVVLAGLVEKYDLQNVHIDEVVGGSVVTHAKDWNLVREAVIDSKLSPTSPGITMMQACGTSLQAMMGSAAKIATGRIECAISLGSDTVSDAPVVFSRKFAQRMVALSRARSLKEKLATFKGFHPKELTPQPPSVNEPRTGLSMGQHCELMAQAWHIPRAAQDQLACKSHKKAAKAYDEGFHDDLIVPCAGVFRDNNLRHDIDLDKISTLKNAFEKSNRGSLTPANSTPLTDGASCVLIASEEWAKARGLPILAFLIDIETSANDFVAGEGLLMAPTVAVGRMIKRQDMRLQDFDLYEIHEAFAAQVLATLKAWKMMNIAANILAVIRRLGLLIVRK